MEDVEAYLGQREDGQVDYVLPADVLQHVRASQRPIESILAR